MNTRTLAAAKDMEAQRVPDWKLAYTIPELAAATGYGETTLHEAISEGRLVAHTDGPKKTYVMRDDAITFLLSNPRRVPTKLKVVANG